MPLSKYKVVLCHQDINFENKTQFWKNDLILYHHLAFLNQSIKLFNIMQLIFTYIYMHAQKVLKL